MKFTPRFATPFREQANRSTFVHDPLHPGYSLRLPPFASSPLPFAYLRHYVSQFRDANILLALFDIQCTFIDSQLHASPCTSFVQSEACATVRTTNRRSLYCSQSTGHRILDRAACCALSSLLLLCAPFASDFGVIALCAGQFCASV